MVIDRNISSSTPRRRKDEIGARTRRALRGKSEAGRYGFPRSLRKVSMKLRSHIFVIVSATLVPILALGCIIIVLLFHHMRDSQLQTLTATARALSLAVDRYFETAIATLKTLATAPHIQSGDLRAFHQEAQRILAVQEGSEAVVLVNPAGQQIVNTRRPFGEPLPKGGSSGFSRRVAERRTAAVSNLLTGPLVQRHLVIVGVPIVVDDRVKYVLTMALSPGYLQKLLEQQGVPADSVAAVNDAGKIIVARSRDIDKLLGKPAAPTVSATNSEMNGGWCSGAPWGNEASYVVQHRSEFSGWNVVITIPRAKADAPFWRALQFLGGGIVLFLVVALSLAVAFGRRITSSIAALAAGAKELGTGSGSPITPSPVFELDHVRREIESASAKRKEMEASLRQSETRLRAIIDNEPECVNVVAPDGKLLDMNPAGLRMLDAESLETIAGKSILEFVVEKCRDAFAELHRKVMSGGSGTLEFEAAGLKGSKRWLETHAVPLRDGAGQVAALLGVTRDVTERKRAEEALRNAHDELELRVQERTRELSAANERLKEVDRLKSEFLATMSHELRTPLNSIMGFTSLMHDGKVGPIAPQHREYLGDVMTSAEHLLQLINDVLDLSKIEAGKMTIVADTFRVAEAIDEVKQSLAPTAARKGLNLVVAVAEDFPPITSDRLRFMQILLNLASNAVKFTPKGEVRIECNTVQRQLQLSVTDTGCGIKEDKMIRLFQPFSQVDGSLGRKHEGTGLGLYLAQRLAHLLGGEITAASEYGKGSTFTLTLPLTPQVSSGVAIAS